MEYDRKALLRERRKRGLPEYAQPEGRLNRVDRKLPRKQITGAKKKRLHRHIRDMVERDPNVSSTEIARAFSGVSGGFPVTREQVYYHRTRLGLPSPRPGGSQDGSTAQKYHERGAA